MKSRISARNVWLLSLLVIMAVLSVACTPTSAKEEPTPEPTEEPSGGAPVAVTEPEPEAQPDAPEANIAEGCVETYDEEIDYFPDKITVDYASGFTVEYFNNYKVVTVTTPWPGATGEDQFQYVLVQCGTPTPEGYDDAYIIDVPVDTVIVMSTTQLPHVVELGVLDSVAGVDTTMWTNSDAIVEKYQAGELVEVGDAFDPTAVNIELILDISPDVVLTYGSGFPEYDSYPAVIAAGIPVAMNAEHVEALPVARAEWVKFTALFFNKELLANEFFAGIAERYGELVAMTAGLADEDKPVVLLNTFDAWSNSWVIPGPSTFVGRLIYDAGGIVVLRDDLMVAEGSGFFDFEVVYDAGIDADVWITNSFGWYTLADALTADPRYGDLSAFQSGQVYNNNARENVNGGNDWFESGVMRPDLVLADLIAILHPDLMLDYEPYYYTQLGPAE